MNRNKVRRLVIVIHPVEPIHKEKEIKVMTPLNLGNVPLGQRVPVDFVPDEPVDLRSDGVNFIGATVTAGDSTVLIAPGGTSLKSRVYFNGDGGIGAKSAVVAMDGHVGDGDVEITQEIDWTVTSPDATTFTATPGPLEPIPAAAPATAAAVK